MRKVTPLNQRFDASYKVDPSTGCWLWQRYVMPNGYCYIGVGGRGNNQYAHRVSYERFKGPIPDGMQVDHLCRVRHCVNPDHLEAVTQRENALRGVSFSAQNARKTHCDRGHLLSGDNLIVRSTWRACRACQTLTRQAHRSTPEYKTKRAALRRAAKASRPPREKMPPRNGNTGKTHCKRGHELIGDNLKISVYRGHTRRECRTCLRAFWRERAKNRKPSDPSRLTWRAA